MLFYYVIKEEPTRNIVRERDSLELVIKSLQDRVNLQLKKIDSLYNNRIVIEKKYEILKYSIIKSNDANVYLDYITKSISNQ